jgi:hypothetical protein
MSKILNGLDVELKELEWLLGSGVLGRSQNLVHMLKFICDKHFQGQASQITEYAVAVEALGRRSDFNPQSDTIVRVTAHQLRKRLQEVYEGEGAGRPVHILIPPGQYAPSFVRHDQATEEALEDETMEEIPEGISTEIAAGISTPAIEEVPVAESELPITPARAPLRWWLILGTVLASAALIWGTLQLENHLRKHRPISSATNGAGGTVVMGHAVRALLGDGRQPYLDRSGFTWTPGNFCAGGSSVSEPVHEIAGTEDPTIFLAGIRGNSHCIFPVDPGIYEVHLLFSEDSDLQEATTRAVIFLNGSDGNTLDVVDDAGGNYIATTKVYSGVRPENDGAIHIDFVSEASALKAVEILPASSEALLPIRILGGATSSYKDPEGHLWLADHYYIGGRRGQLPANAQAEEGGLYGSHRVGHFRYILPVIPSERYRVRLYFQEPWFGKQNGGTGGASSRIFDVWCNGIPLLHHFDILQEANTDPVIKTFDHVQATAQGKIELYFTPVVNYPIVDAIEVLPESPQ